MERLTGPFCLGRGRNPCISFHTCCRQCCPLAMPRRNYIAIRKLTFGTRSAAKNSDSHEPKHKTNKSHVINRTFVIDRTLGFITHEPNHRHHLKTTTARCAGLVFVPSACTCLRYLVLRRSTLAHQADSTVECTQMKAKTIRRARTQRLLCQNCCEKWLRLDTPSFINDIAATEIACRDRNRKEAAMEIAVSDRNRGDLRWKSHAAIEIARRPRWKSQSAIEIARGLRW